MTRRPEDSAKDPQTRGAEEADERKVVTFPRANLRHIFRKWAEDQIATGRARPKSDDNEKADPGQRRRNDADNGDAGRD